MCCTRIGDARVAGGRSEGYGWDAAACYPDRLCSSGSLGRSCVLPSLTFFFARLMCACNLNRGVAVSQRGEFVCVGW